MPNWNAIAAAAKKLIDKNGRTVIVRKQGSNPQDSEKPWRSKTEYPESSVTGSGVFVPPGKGLGRSSSNEENIKRAEQSVYFAAADDTGLNLIDYDIIIDNDVEWKIVSAELLSPAGTRLLYQFGVAR